MNITDLLQQYLPLIGRSFIMYLVIILFLRIFGQKQISDLNLQDFVLVILIAEVSHSGIMGEDTSFAGSALSLLTLLIANRLINMIFFHFPKIRRKLEPKPHLIINHGKIDLENMRKIHLNLDELQEILRENGNLSMKEIKFGIMENDGKFSIIPTEEKEGSGSSDQNKEAQAT